MRTFRAYFANRNSSGKLTSIVQPVPATGLPAGDVEFRVHYSSVNYKDALSAAGHPGVTHTFPHVPGIDAAGTVTESQDGRFQPGDAILVTGFDFGMNHWGGFAEMARVPASWVMPMPDGLSMWEAMALGTAGLTVALGVDACTCNGLVPNAGPVLVTGATGGVGSLAVAILARLGYHVVAATGKTDAEDYLRMIGAREVVSRETLLKDRKKSLQSERYAGAFDTVGGPVLAAVLASMHYRGVVAACGLVGGSDLSTTVYPFILRAVRLLGIDSAQAPMPERTRLWRLLAGPWKPAHLPEIARDVPLGSVDEALSRIGAGKARGRTVVVIAPS